MEIRPLITRVMLENYKSIGFCDVELGPLAILVGPNGAGKSNFVDALRFLSEAMNAPVEKALQDRGGFANVLFRRAGEDGHLGIRIEFITAQSFKGHYSVRFARGGDREYYVAREKCHLDRPGLPGYDLRNDSRQLHLPVSELAELRPVWGLISNCRFYNFSPKDFLQPASESHSNRILYKDARNLANILNWIRSYSLVRAELESEVSPAYARIIQYMQAINPALESITTEAIGGFRYLRFFLRDSSSDATPFLPGQMSDGTLRSLAVLAALFQRAAGVWDVSLVGLEEPEAALHPAAAGVLFDALREASASVQVIATTHSADLLDKKEIETDSILSVELDQGKTRIAHLDPTGRQALKEQLYTAGELMRMNYLRPEPLKTPADSEIEDRLFKDLVPA
jgi:predicted ATPase